VACWEVPRRATSWSSGRHRRSQRRRQPEIVTGKTRYAHTYNPAAEEPSLLVYYTVAPGPVFRRHDLDAASGIGRSVTVGDVDGDHRPNIVGSNKNGLFYFRRR